MIDFLSDDILPTTIDCDGEDIHIKTDFRVWIAFGHDLQVAEETNGRLLVPYIFADEDLSKGKEWVVSALKFYHAVPPTPKAEKDSSRVRIYDFVLDADYIYASFMQAYNIDLVDIEYLHWFKFKAMFLGLPESTKMVEIMRMRGWKKSNIKPDTLHERLRRIWTLPEHINVDIIKEHDAEYERQLEFFGFK